MSGVGQPFFGAHRRCAPLDHRAGSHDESEQGAYRQSCPVINITKDLELEMVTSISEFSEQSNCFQGDSGRCRRLRVVTCANDAAETAGSVWHAGIALSRYLATRMSQSGDGANISDSYVKTPGHCNDPMVVVELGAGCGVPALVVAACNGTPYGADIHRASVEVFLTDVEENIDHLNDVIQLNSASFPSSVCVKARRLYFGCDEDAEALRSCLPCGSIDLVLGADIGFDLNLHPLITSTLLKLACKDSTRILLCEEVRWKDIFTWYMDEVGRAFDVVYLDEIDEVARAAVSSTGSRRPIRLLELRRREGGPCRECSPQVESAPDYKSIKRICMQEEEAEQAVEKNDHS